MKCPRCSAEDTKVIDTRGRGAGLTIRRRRECPDCGYRFTTHEVIAETSISVIKKDDSRSPFEREKIRSGVEKACYKRPISEDQILDLIASVEAELLSSGENEIRSHRIGELVMKRLHALDKVAYVRFASVYRNFQDVSDFAQEIQPMLDTPSRSEAKP